jgi:putative membrane protein
MSVFGKSTLEGDATMMWGYYGGPASGYGLIMMLVMGVFWVAIIFGLVSFIRHGFRHRPLVSGGGEDPLEILKRRYARGEIAKEEYEQVRKDLLGL